MNWELYKKSFIQKYSANKIDIDSQIILLKYAKSLFDAQLPIIYNIEHFSLLVGYQDFLLYNICFSKEKYYHTFYILKRNGKKRQINEPYPTLKEIQYWIMNNILKERNISKYAKAYVPNAGIIDNVKFHKNQNVIIKLDIKNFFDSITFKDIYTIYRQFGYTKNVSHLLANLCTLNNRLPQGSPCSPILSNIFFKSIDERIGAYLRSLNYRYTRYSDDITISGDIKNEQIHAIICFIEKILNEKDLRLNKSKTKILRKNHCQYVTGVVLNNKISAGNKYKKSLRQEIHFIKKFGLENHMQHENINKQNYIFHLMGKINWVLYLEKNNKEFIEYKDFLKRYLNT